MPDRNPTTTTQLDSNNTTILIFDSACARKCILHMCIYPNIIHIHTVIQKVSKIFKELGFSFYCVLRAESCHSSKCGIGSLIP